MIRVELLCVVQHLLACDSQHLNSYISPFVLGQQLNSNVWCEYIQITMCMHIVVFHYLYTWHANGCTHVTETHLGEDCQVFARLTGSVPLTYK